MFSVKAVKQVGFGIWILTGSEEDNYNVLYVHFVYPGFIIRIPRIIKLNRHSDNYAATKQYGFYFGSQYLFLYYGMQNFWDSVKNPLLKVIEYPWNYGTAIRHSYFDINGCHIYDWKKLKNSNYKSKRNDYRKLFVMEKIFNFINSDGDEVFANVSIEEREWRRGTTLLLKKLFRPFCKPLIIRNIDIEFNSEVGKNSLLGISFNMKNNETIDECWERFLKEGLVKL
jgi:hypothetical protein